MLIVLAARPRQLDERLQGALDRADRQGALTRVELGGLPRAAVTELLGDGVGDARADQLYEDTGGNPFYLQQLVRAPARTAAAARRAWRRSACPRR